MTRKIAAALAAAAALGLSACASPEGGTSTATQRATQAPGSATVERATAPAETYKAPSLSLDEIAERAFLNTVSEYRSPSDAASLMVGRATCELLDEGSTPDTLAYELLVADGPVVPGFSNDELPHFYGAAMGALCPEHGERFFG